LGDEKSASQLTIVALAFALLLFTTGLFSMSGSFLPGQADWWVFWAVSVPFVAPVFITAFATKHFATKASGRKSTNVREGRVAVQHLPISNNLYARNRAFEDVPLFES
jgi:hypothetical protein